MRKVFFLAGKRGSATFLGVDFTCFFTGFLATPCAEEKAGSDAESCKRSFREWGMA